MRDVMLLRNPEIRELILRRLERFADADYQDRVWARREIPAAPQADDDFDEAVNDLADGVGEPGTGVGDVFLDDAEVAAAVEFMAALDVVIDDIDRFGTFEAARTHPAWPRVITAAQAALEAMGRGPRAWGTTVAELEGLERDVRRVVGHRLERVNYLTRGPDSGVVHRTAPSREELDYGLELLMDGGERFFVGWASRGFDHGLVFRPAAGADGLAADGSALMVARTAAWWEQDLGKRVTEARTHWYVPEDDCARCLLGVRLLLDGTPLTLALGTLEHGAPTWMPDAVVALRDPAEADAYIRGVQAACAGSWR